MWQIQIRDANAAQSQASEDRVLSCHLGMLHDSHRPAQCATCTPAGSYPSRTSSCACPSRASATHALTPAEVEVEDVAIPWSRSAWGGLLRKQLVKGHWGCQHGWCFHLNQWPPCPSVPKTPEFLSWGWNLIQFFSFEGTRVSSCSKVHLISLSWAITWALGNSWMKQLNLVIGGLRLAASSVPL